MLPKEIRQYLKNNPNTLQVLIDRWDKGKVVSVDTDVAGWANINVKVVTSMGDFFLRLTNTMRRTREDLEREEEVLTYLSQHDMPVVKSLASSSGESVTVYDCFGEHFWVNLFPSADGTVVKSPTLSQIRSMGEMMARIDGVLAGMPSGFGFREFDFDRELNVLNANIIEKRELVWPYPEVIAEGLFWSFWQDRMNCMRKYYQSEKVLFDRSSLIHGDYHQENLSFSGDKVEKVFDFDNLICAPRIVDIAVCLYHLKYQHKVINEEYPEICRTLLSGYEKISSLSTDEKMGVLWLAEFWLWSLTPQLHYYSGNVPGHRELQADRLRTTLVGIKELQELGLE
jgi:Ser/Thr protein kinase RdoA (MazF antagonist)